MKYGYVVGILGIEQETVFFLFDPQYSPHRHNSFIQAF